MNRRERLGITKDQAHGLELLAIYLMNLPEDYDEFDMEHFMEITNPNSRNTLYAQSKPVCGAVACSMGHAPLLARIKGDAFKMFKPLGDERWNEYSFRVFGAVVADALWSWCFSAYWKGLDNTPKGAGQRILYALKHGLPSTQSRFSQLNGAEKLCYTNIKG